MSNIRFVGVLQRIAICYLFAAILFLYLSDRAIWMLTAGLAFGYAVLLELVPAPGGGSNAYDQATNLVIWVDANWLPGRRHFGTWDPEGLLTTIPAISSCLIGVCAGNLLLKKDLQTSARAQAFVASGLLLLAAGYALSWQIPVIKNLWTASYVLIAGGWSLILLGLAHRLMEGAGITVWALPAVWIGANAILFYVMDRLVDPDVLILTFLGSPATDFLEHLGGSGTSRLLANAAGLALAIALARELYVRRISLRF